MLKIKYSAPTRRRRDNKKVKKPAWHIFHAIPAPPPWVDCGVVVTN